MTFNPIPKQPMIRSPKLLKLAEKCPRCMSCHEENHNRSVVAAHSNSLIAGKGMGQKAHDIPAYVCQRCHSEIDGRDCSTMLPEDRELKHLRAVYLSIVWLIQEGHLEVKK